jgi:hypothetical protein
MEEMNMNEETNTETTQKEVFARKSDVNIFTSNQYDKFVLSELNRVPGHYKKVLQSIKDNDYTKYQPILVNSKMEIVDGQNRFLACKELGLPIHFIVSDEIKIFAAADINRASKNWTAMDYAIHYAKRGREPYIKLLDLCAKYNQKLSIVQCFGKMSGGSHRSHSENVKSGGFQFRDDVDIEDFLEHMMDFDSYYNFSKKDKFVKAVLKLYLTKGYDKDKMRKKLRIASGIVHEQPRVDMMTEEILKLYNYKSRKPLKVKI